MSYVPLRNYTQYSIQESILSLGPWLSRLAEQQLSAVGCCDKNNFFGMVRFYQKAVKLGLKPLLGSEVLYQWGPKSRPVPIIFYAKDHQGYTNLSKMITEVYQQESARPAITLAQLKKHAQGLLAIIPPESFIAFQEHGHSWKELFQGDLLVGVERYEGDPNSAHQSAEILSWAAKKGLPPVALNAVYFLEPEDYSTQQIKVCIQRSEYLQDERRAITQKPHHHVMSPEKMAELFADCPEALENTQRVAQKCTLEFDWGKVLLPEFSQDEVATLREYAQKGLQERAEKGQLGLDDRQQYDERLEVELEVITAMGFSGYFLIVADFIQWAKNAEILVGPGRGSGAGSLVAYVLKITDIDPLPYGLLFERFLNPERVSMPDFDIDFCMIGRDRVIEYVQQRYGSDHVSQIATFGTMAAKAVVRDVGRVHSLPFSFVDKIAKMIPLQIGITLEEALEQNPDFYEMYHKDEQVHELIDFCRKLEGLPRNVGRHAGGVIIAPQPLYEICPLYSESPSPWHPVSHLDKDDIEALGLVKFDFLGLKTLTIIDWTYKKAAAIGIDLTPLEKIPLDDPDSYALLNTGRSTAVFQFESQGMRDLILRLQPDCFEDIIAIVALNRPGPLQSGMVDDFIERKHGRAAIEYPHPWTQEILEETYGIILYQEQVMQLAQKLAGYSLGAADLLRRAMGKKKPEEMAKQRAIFVKGAQDLEIDTEVAEYIFDLMEKFAGYGFNKSHSAAYALIVFQTLYLKTHAPAAFMAATMTADHTNFDKIALFAQDLPHLNITLAPPCVQRSFVAFEPEDAKTIRYGLSGIKGLGDGIVGQLVVEREKNGRFTHWKDFLERALRSGFTQKAVELLIKAGACDYFSSHRRMLLEEALPEDWAAAQKIVAGQQSLFDMAQELDESGFDESRISQKPDYQWSERLKTEIALLGLPLSGGLFDPYSWVQSSLWTLNPKEASQAQPCLLLYVSSRMITTQRGTRLMIVQLLQKGNKPLELILQPEQKEAEKAFAAQLFDLAPYTAVVVGLSFSTSKHNPQKVYTSLVSLELFERFLEENPVLWRWKIHEPQQPQIAALLQSITAEKNHPEMRVDLCFERQGPVLLSYHAQKGPAPSRAGVFTRWIEQAYTYQQQLQLQLEEIPRAAWLLEQNSRTEGEGGVASTETRGETESQ